MFAHTIDNDLVLRVLQPRHAGEVFAAVEANRAHIRQWLPWVDDSRSAADTLAFINRSLEQLARNDGFQCGIWQRGRYVGTIGYLFINSLARRTELGYWLVADACGRGIMTRAVIAMTDHAFDDLKLHRVEIQCATENARSGAVAERLGFKNEGVRRESGCLHGRFVDHVVYGMLEHEWADAKARYRSSTK